MKVNVRENPELASCRVFLDGVEVSADCFEADDEAGYVLVYKRDADGRICEDLEKRGEFAWERREGVVEYLMGDGQWRREELEVADG